MNLGEILRVLLVGYPVPLETVDPGYPAFLQRIGGLELSLVITALALLLGAPLGMALALLRAGPQRGHHPLWRPFGTALKWLAAAIIQAVRGLPAMILVLLAFHLPFRLFRVHVPPVILAIVIFALIGAVYLSEILRSGLRAVDEGWVDAARTLGLREREILTHVRLPIALRAMVPAVVGLAITIFKDTSVLVVVAVPELSRTGRILQTAEPVNYALVLLLTIAMYWAVSFLGSVLVRRIDEAWQPIGGAKRLRAGGVS